MKPHQGQFLMKFILFCVTSDLSDNLTEMRIVKNSNIYDYRYLWKIAVVITARIHHDRHELFIFKGKDNV